MKDRKTLAEKRKSSWTVERALMGWYSPLIPAQESHKWQGLSDIYWASTTCAPTYLFYFVHVLYAHLCHRCFHAFIYTCTQIFILVRFGLWGHIFALKCSTAASGTSPGISFPRGSPEWCSLQCSCCKAYCQTLPGAWWWGTRGAASPLHSNDWSPKTRSESRIKSVISLTTSMHL